MPYEPYGSGKERLTIVVTHEFADNELCSTPEHKGITQVFTFYEDITEILGTIDKVNSRLKQKTLVDITKWIKENWVEFGTDGDKPQKIALIKEVRDRFRLGLKEAKDAVERSEPFMEYYRAYEDRQRLTTRMQELRRGF